MVISAQQIRSNYEVIAPHIRPTPVIEVEAMTLGFPFRAWR